MRARRFDNILLLKEILRLSGDTEPPKTIIRHTAIYMICLERHKVKFMDSFLYLRQSLSALAANFLGGERHLLERSAAKGFFPLRLYGEKCVCVCVSSLMACSGGLVDCARGPPRLPTFSMV